MEEKYCREYKGWMVLYDLDSKDVIRYGFSLVVQNSIWVLRVSDQSDDYYGILESSLRMDRNSRGHIEVLETPPPNVEESSNVHGLVVCGPVEGLYWVVDPKNERFAIWNPSTREQLLLPRVPSTIDTSEENSSEFRAAFCARQCYSYGFGYDDTMDDYKFVLIYAFLLDKYGDPGNVVALNARSFNIFSVNKGEWSTKEWPGIVPWDFGSGVGVFVHGGDEYAWSDVFIVTFNGCLGLVNAHRGDNMNGFLCSSFDVWVMAEYEVTKSWTILYQISLPDGIGGRYLGIVRDRFYYGEGDGWLVSYDLYSKDDERYGVLNSSELGILEHPQW
ncbi:F-box protein CPR1-like [Silene latifolia]|uniref:F-box protein CPR1-like n=1 Tax=Silene latifolia TaxID=37657 RepID=UPI003D76B7CA